MHKRLSLVCGAKCQVDLVCTTDGEGTLQSQSLLRSDDISKEVARKEREQRKKDNEDLLWGKPEFNKKYELKNQINEAMVKEGLPEVDMDLVAWRMSRAIGALKLAEGRSKKGNEGPVATTECTAAGADTASFAASSAALQEPIQQRSVHLIQYEMFEI
ncbi:hypothetical protein GQ44DRAFT_726378 [Phaeosphaeriaceae sp. PMI808]|nr:hypothetical protein GQ44DRAFT_726378 [Phaeosphaeriaceae sp. PMI808]